MATRQSTTGIAHLTVVPENFEASSEEDPTGEGDEGVVDSGDRHTSGT